MSRFLDIDIESGSHVKFYIPGATCQTSFLIFSSILIAEVRRGHPGWKFLHHRLTTYPVRTSFWYPEYFLTISWIFARDKTNAIGHPGLFIIKIYFLLSLFMTSQDEMRIRVRDRQHHWGRRELRTEAEPWQRRTMGGDKIKLTSDCSSGQSINGEHFLLRLCKDPFKTYDDVTEG